MTTEGHYHEVLSELSPAVKELRSMTGETWTAFANLNRAAMAEGAIDSAHKELIALAIAITRECDGCIASHARGAVKKGVTRQQVAEMVGVAILLNGGPATVYGPRAYDAFVEYEQAMRGTTPQP
ncbi:MAG: carboxymuconolactone decarboxylase family protein [Actinomycetota bacterium]|nr:carboxymuconolactone decarboxylase family protein [Actinomycetota bacterium]